MSAGVEYAVVWRRRHRRYAERRVFQRPAPAMAFYRKLRNDPSGFAELRIEARRVAEWRPAPEVER